MNIKGKWQIQSETSWLEKFTEGASEDEPGLAERDNVFEFKDKFQSFHIDGLTGNMDCEFDEESMLLEFSWDGETEDSSELIHGRGWIQFGDEITEGMLFIHVDEAMQFSLTRDG